MKTLARSYFWCPGVDREIESLTKNCIQRSKYAKNPPKTMVHPWEWPSKPWEWIHIYFAGHFLNSMHLIVVDAHSKWPEVFSMNTITSGKTIEILRSLFCRYGLPKTLVSDNGRYFFPIKFQTFLKKNDIYHIKTIPYCPSSNGQAERFVQTFKDAMRQAQVDFGSRDYKWQKFLMQYRKTPHSTTHQSPAMMFLGRDIRTRLDLLRPNETQCEKVTDSPVRQFDVGDKVAIHDFSNTDGK
ncbi:Uncharacterized protein K02A2.6 [Araneus ventricosus]|uniref:Uncharacterized protein K02A2.6 n=1 Tax=Araneus ventricosus TaxID=182803 RepID=A0A4Y2BK46_ARAVE|nr:Uncharacterized protein K02A2.6 [Araneus ventricosus]